MQLEKTEEKKNQTQNKELRWDRTKTDGKKKKRIPKPEQEIAAEGKKNKGKKKAAQGITE